MNTTLTASEIVAQGKVIYDQSIKPVVEIEQNIGKFVTVDIKGGDYELADDRNTARANLVSRKPDAVIYLLKVGYPATAVIGGRLQSNPEWCSN